MFSAWSARRPAALLLACTLLCAVLGCGGKQGNNPPRAKVSGRVLLDAQPAPAGVIVFIPITKGQLQAQGLIQDDGTFEIAEADGPSPGDYKVDIQCSKKTGRRIQSISSSDGTGMIDERLPVIPARYNSATTLRQTITPGDNVLEFKLTSGR